MQCRAWPQAAAVLCCFLKIIFWQVSRLEHTMAMSEVEGLSTLEVQSMVRGYHVYKDLWTAVVGEELQCGESLETLETLLL